MTIKTLVDRIFARQLLTFVDEVTLNALLKGHPVSDEDLEAVNSLIDALIAGWIRTESDQIRRALAASWVQTA